MADGEQNCAVELSIVCDCGRYCRLLVQEFAVKIDQGFLMAVLALFTSGEATDDQKTLEFQKDLRTVDQSLMDDTIQSATAGVRNFYDHLHCSPIKVIHCVLFCSYVYLLNYFD